MTIDRLLAAVAATLTALVLIIGGWLTIADQKALLDEARRREVDKTAVVFTTAMDQAATLSATHAELIAADAVARTLLAAGDRAGLQAHARPVLERLNRLAGIDVLHFHAADMKSFLRVWDPGNFGQDLSAFRPMIVAANHDHRTRKGLELGVRGLSLRAVAAVMDGERLVGTVEAGVSLQSLADLAKAATGSDYALVLDPAFLKDVPAATRSSASGLVLDANTDKALFERVLAAGEAGLSRDSTLFTFPNGGRDLTIQGRPLIDYSGNMIGAILTTSDFGSLETHYRRTVVTIAAIGLAGFLVVFAAIMTAIRFTVVRPLQALTRAVEDNPAGAAGAAEGGLKDYADLRRALGRALDVRENEGG